jgi:adenylyl cyclase-associated protein
MTQSQEPPLGHRGHIQVSGNVLTTMLRRLEAATSRLEDIASSSIVYDSPVPNGGAAVASGSVAGSSVSQTSAPKAPEALPPSIQDFDGLVDGELKEWLQLSSKLGAVIDGQVCRQHYMRRNTDVFLL